MGRWSGAMSVWEFGGIRCLFERNEENHETPVRVGGNVTEIWTAFSEVKLSAALASAGLNMRIYMTRSFCYMFLIVLKLGLLLWEKDIN